MQLWSKAEYVLFSKVTCQQSSQMYYFEYVNVRSTSSNNKLEPIRDVSEIIYSWDQCNFKKIKYKSIITKQDELFVVQHKYLVNL